VRPDLEAISAEVDAGEQAAAQNLHYSYCCQPRHESSAIDLPDNTTSASIKAPCNAENPTLTSSIHPHQHSADPAPSQSATTLIKSPDTTKQNANSTTFMSMQDGIPPPGWKSENERGWLDYLMSSPKTIKETRTNAPSTDEITINEQRLDDMLGFLHFHNSIFRGMFYAGVLSVLCLAIGSIAFTEKRLDNMLDNLDVYDTVCRDMICVGALLTFCMTIWIRTCKRNRRYASFVESFVL